MSSHVGIKFRNLDKSLQDRVLSGSGQASQVGLRPGVNAVNTYYVPANLVNGDVLTIGADTFEVDIINTDTTANVASGLANTDDPALLTLTGAPGITINAGDMLRVENEIMKVLRKISATQYVVARARGGTTIASHADTTDVFQSDAPPAANIPIPLVTTLTPAVFIPSFVDEFTNAAAGGETATAKAPTENANFAAYNLASKNQLLIVALDPGADTTATTEDFSNSTDNVVANATMVGGVNAGVLRSEMASRAVSSAEELAGEMHFAFPFTVRAAAAFVRKATGEQTAFAGQVFIGYAETTPEVLPATIVTVKNAGQVSTAYIVPFAATDVVSVIAYE